VLNADHVPGCFLGGERNRSLSCLRNDSSSPFPTYTPSPLLPVLLRYSLGPIEAVSWPRALTMESFPFEEKAEEKERYTFSRVDIYYRVEVLTLTFVANPIPAVASI
jgi:hypothetical protein